MRLDQCFHRSMRIEPVPAVFCVPIMSQACTVTVLAALTQAVYITVAFALMRSLGTPRAIVSPSTAPPSAKLALAECELKCPRKLLDTADIVSERCNS